MPQPPGVPRRLSTQNVIVLSERYLRRTLTAYFDYYHRWRTHLSLDVDCPDRDLCTRLIGVRSFSFPTLADCITTTNGWPHNRIGLMLRPIACYGFLGRTGRTT